MPEPSACYADRSIPAEARWSGVPFCDEAEDGAEDTKDALAAVLRLGLLRRRSVGDRGGGRLVLSQHLGDLDIPVFVYTGFKAGEQAQEPGA